MSRANLPPEPERASGEIDDYLEWQAERTRPLRRFLYRKAGLRGRRSVLDAGCGTGLITDEIASGTNGRVCGIDIDEAMVRGASAARVGIEFTRADVRSLPFEDARFDLVVSHFLLMWVMEPGRALAEMARVLEPGGVVLACAEPDYGGRIEYPENPLFSGAVAEALAAGGADPYLGRRLGELFRAAGLKVETGVSATLLEGGELARGFAVQRAVCGRELEAVLDAAQVQAALEIEGSQAQAGKMVMVPLFWALGRKEDRS